MAYGNEVITNALLGRERLGNSSPNRASVPLTARSARSAPSTLQQRLALRQRLTALTDDLHELWRDSLASGDVELVTSAGEASQSVHRAIFALDDGRVGRADPWNGARV